MKINFFYTVVFSLLSLVILSCNNSKEDSSISKEKQEWIKEIELRAKSDTLLSIGEYTLGDPLTWDDLLKDSICPNSILILDKNGKGLRLFHIQRCPEYYDNHHMVIGDMYVSAKTDYIDADFDKLYELYSTKYGNISTYSTASEVNEISESDSISIDSMKTFIHNSKHITLTWEWANTSMSIDKNDDYMWIHYSCEGYKDRKREEQEAKEEAIN